MYKQKPRKIHTHTHTHTHLHISLYARFLYSTDMRSTQLLDYEIKSNRILIDYFWPTFRMTTTTTTSTMIMMMPCLESWYKTCISKIPNDRSHPNQNDIPTIRILKTFKERIRKRRRRRRRLIFPYQSRLL